MPQATPKIYLCAFANLNLSTSAYRFYHQAQAMDIFENIFIYNECSLDLDFMREFKGKIYEEVRLDEKSEKKLRENGGGGRYDPFFMGQRCIRITRGFGYWCFKPQVILQSLRQINENDILIYADIGCEFVKEARDSLLKKLQEMQYNDIMVFSGDHGERAKIKYWTKGDVLKYFGYQNDTKFLETCGFAGGFLVVKKTNKSMQIIQEWLDIFANHFNLVDDSPSNFPNFPNFIENRHDQTILTMIAKRHKLNYYNYNNDKEMLDFGIMVSRKSWDTMGHLFDFNGKAKFDLGAKILTSTNSKTLKRFLYIGGRILPSKKARKQCRAWLDSMR